MKDREYCRELKKLLNRLLMEKSICFVTLKYDFGEPSFRAIERMRIYQSTEQDAVKYLLGQQRNNYSLYRDYETLVTWLFKDRQYRFGMNMDVFQRKDVSFQFALEDFVTQYLNCYDSRIDWKGKKQFQGKARIRISLKGGILQVSYKML